jgi:carbonic anhydrase
MNEQQRAEVERPGPAAAVLRRLLDGNQRYSRSGLVHPDQSAVRRAEVAAGQHPIAAVLGCADSRVPPEILFDEGLGDLFVVRVAGNIVDDAVLGSIEYAAEEFALPLVMVLGHTRCGAVAATVAALAHPGPVPGHISTLVEGIRPAAECVRDQPGDAVANAVDANAVRSAAQLREAEPTLARLVQQRRLEVVAARYDLDSGRVTLLT